MRLLEHLFTLPVISNMEKNNFTVDLVPVKFIIVQCREFTKFWVNFVIIYNLVRVAI